MKYNHFESYLSDRYTLKTEKKDEKTDEILEGLLIPKDLRLPHVRIVKGIPRFVDSSNYANSFGLQWNIFRTTQLDSVSGLPLTSDRFWKNTKWSKEEIRGKNVLEIGSGAGRFTEVLLQAEAKVISVDLSNAVEANYGNNLGKGDLFLFQGDLYDLPLADDQFDFVFCHGVLQHTPDPEKAYRSIFKKLKPGGKISIDYYLRSWMPSPWSFPKYLWRPLTKRMNPELLFKIIKSYIPIYLPIDTMMRRIPHVGELLCVLIPIPCWNYIDIGLDEKQRVEWAVMDTFDALSAAYDCPKPLEEVRKMITSPECEAIDIFYGGTGIVANSIKTRKQK